MLIALAVFLGWGLLASIDGDAFDVTAVPATGSGGGEVITATSTTFPTSGDEPVTDDTAPPDTTQARPPAEVVVRVANGTGTPGIAGRVSDQLRPAGYQLAEPTDASRTIDTSSVQFVPGFEAEALQVALALGLTPEAVGQLEAVPPVVGGVEGVNVVVLVGPELDQ